MRLNHRDSIEELPADGPARASIRETSDAANGRFTSYRMSEGDTFQGSLSRSGDRDWVSIKLEAGETYTFNLSGSASGGGSLSDPYLRLHSSNGTQLRYDDDSGPGLDSSLTFSASQTGTYYINAGAYSDSGTGSYTLAAVKEQPASARELANYLTHGFWQDRGLTTRSFEISDDGTITVNLTGLTADGKRLARWALEAWETVSGIKFVETRGTADITFDDSQSGAFADSSVSNGRILSSTVNISQDWLSRYGTSIDSYSYQTYVHEVGHALGLGHQGNYNGNATYGTDNKFSNDSWQMSIMSYFSQTENSSTDASYAFLLTPMMADIIAIQNLYGRPDGDSATAGNTVWGRGNSVTEVLEDYFGRQVNYRDSAVALTVYDLGGVDTLDVSSHAGNNRVDLRPGHFSSTGGLTENIGIARGTVIEILLTGSGNDKAIGNSADNVIRTRGGNDTVRGRDGDDTIRGGNGQDKLLGGNGQDSLTGKSGSDTLFGGDGNDRLAGGSGNDRLVGEQGRDRLIASTGDDRLNGGRGSDILFAGEGRDTLRGGQGNDTLTGGENGDVFVFQGNHGQDRITDFGTTESQEQIDLSGISTFRNFSDVRAAAASTSDGVLIVTGSKSSVLLEDVQLKDLSVGDFIF